MHSTLSAIFIKPTVPLKSLKHYVVTGKVCWFWYIWHENIAINHIFGSKPSGYISVQLMKEFLSSWQGTVCMLRQVGKVHRKLWVPVSVEDLPQLALQGLRLWLWERRLLGDHQTHSGCGKEIVLRPVGGSLETQHNRSTIIQVTRTKWMFQINNKKNNNV